MVLPCKYSCWLRIWMPSATALTSFLCYTLIAGEKLTVSKAFTSIALFSQLQEPMVSLPGQIFAMLYGNLSPNYVTHLWYWLYLAYVSMQRIDKFLEEDEVPSWASTLTATPTGEGFREVKFCDATFEWEERKLPSASPSRFQLGPLNLTFPQGGMSLIIGATGSGKSALLAALLGGETKPMIYIVLNWPFLGRNALQVRAGFLRQNFPPGCFLWAGSLYVCCAYFHCRHSSWF